MPEATHHFHVGLSVRGYLTGPDKDCRRLFRHPGGRWFSAAEAKAQLAEELAAGREVLPFGVPCDGWSYADGCPGHTDDLELNPAEVSHV